MHRAPMISSPGPIPTCDVRTPRPNAMAAERLVETMSACGLTGPSWAAWRVVAKVLDAEPLTVAERAIFEACTHRTRPPSTAPAEAFLIVGRRGGKSRFVGACSTRAAAGRYRLAPGESAVVALAAADRA